MDEFRRMLLAVDLDPSGRALSPGSRLAAEQTLTLARASGATVTVFHSTWADEIWDPKDGEYRVESVMSDAGRDALEAVCEELRGAGVTAEVELSEERPAFGIVHEVLRGGVDLVVSGKRGQAEGGAHRIGSVAMKLLRKCPCPVWVARPGGTARPRRVMAATDFSPVGDRVIALATRVATFFEAELHLVHSFQMPFDVQWEGGGSEAEFERRERESSRRRLEEQVAETKFGGEVTYYVGLTSPSRAILSCNERIQPDLVVMGTVSRGGVAGLLVGNTAERLLDRLDCSLLTVKPADFVCPISLA